MKRPSEKTRLQQGKGSGKGSSYKPWDHPKHVPSQGVSHRIIGIKTKRQVNLLSNLELDFFLYADFSENVHDIREQFVIKSLKETLKIAKEKNIPHNRGNDGNPVRLTIDFLLTIKDGRKTRQAAVMVKPSAELEKKRVIEKFEIAREWCVRNDIEFIIVTEKELDRNISNNLKLFRATEVKQKISRDAFLKFLRMSQKRKREMTIRSFADEASAKFGVDRKNCIQNLHYLFLKKAVTFDYGKPFKDSFQLHQLSIS